GPGGPGGAGGAGGHGSIEGAVAVVQRMYKEVFLPMALLFLLPGAIFTQVKGLVGNTMLGPDEDSVNPFTGIIRAIIAIFLIHSTQLIVSYCIDIGNALSYEVARTDRPWIQEDKIRKWAKEQTFNPNPSQVDNAMLPPGSGKSSTEGQNRQAGAGRQQGGPGGPGGGPPGPGGPSFGRNLGTFFRATNPVVAAFTH